MQNTTGKEIDAYIRRVHDFPKPGICFYDITTLFQDPQGFDLALSIMADHIRSLDVIKVVGIEARGFVMGAALADRLKLGFVPVRKPGKLPHKKITEAYTLEYGMDQVEMHCDAISEGERVVVVDDLIATGGTVHATCKLVERLGGEVAGISCVVALPFLSFQEVLAGYNLHYLVEYNTETVSA